MFKYSKDEYLQMYKNKSIKLKDMFTIIEIDKYNAHKFCTQYHYLEDKDFMFKYAYGLFINTTLVGCAVYGNIGGRCSIQSWFDADNSSSNEYIELVRLVMLPDLNGGNATSFLLSNSIKRIKKDHKEVKAIISLADTSRHVGYIYQACNFKYYGVTSQHKDFYPANSIGVINPRSKNIKLSDMQGVYVVRSLKYRYCYLLDKSVKVKYKEEPYPKALCENLSCCNGTKIVYDNRFNKYYTCPVCYKKCLDITDVVKAKIKESKAIKEG